MSPAFSTDSFLAALEPLAASYFPATGDIKIVVGAGAGRQQFFSVFKRDQNEIGADQDSIFEIGASSMVFTSCLLADMASRCEVSFDSPISKHLPLNGHVPSYRGQEITLLDLAQHTSSLPRLPFNFHETITDPANPCKDYTYQHLYAFLATHQLGQPIGWRRSYSNLGMGLLGHLLELAARQPFAKLLHERLCVPLGLGNTAVSLSVRQQGALLQGHAPTGEPATGWDMPALVGAGGVRSTAHDLLLLLRTHAAADGPLGKTLLPHPKTGRRAAWAYRYGAAGSLCVMALLIMTYLAPAPATLGFLALFFVPILLAALYGGVGPGLLAVAGQTLGAACLAGGGFSGILHGILGAALAWLASSRHRELAQAAPLGWMHTRNRVFDWSDRCFWLSGETGGYASFIGLNPKRDMAVVVLANCAKPVAQLGYQALKLLSEDQPCTPPPPAAG